MDFPLYVFMRSISIGGSVKYVVVAVEPVIFLWDGTILNYT